VLLVVALGQSTAASAVGQAASATSLRNAAAWQALLDAEGFARVSAEMDRHGTWHLSGHVDTADQRARLEQLAVAQGVAAQVDAWVNEALAAALQEVLRVQGVPAEARVEERGRAHVTTHLADASRLAALKAVLLRDVPGVSDVVLDNVAAEGQRAHASPHVDDPGKRVSSVVPGDPPYVVTADGTRYFEGALLPTGQRVVSIREGEVVLSDVSGGTATLRF
jgi:type III secretion protein D